MKAEARKDEEGEEEEEVRAGKVEEVKGSQEEEEVCKERR